MEVLSMGKINIRYHKLKRNKLNQIEVVIYKFSMKLKITNEAIPSKAL